MGHCRKRTTGRPTTRYCEKYPPALLRDAKHIGVAAPLVFRGKGRVIPSPLPLILDFYSAADFGKLGRLDQSSRILDIDSGFEFRGPPPEVEVRADMPHECEAPGEDAEDSKPNSKAQMVIKMLKGECMKEDFASVKDFHNLRTRAKNFALEGDVLFKLVKGGRVKVLLTQKEIDWAVSQAHVGGWAFRSGPHLSSAAKNRLAVWRYAARSRRCGKEMRQLPKIQPAPCEGCAPHVPCSI